MSLDLVQDLWQQGVHWGKILATYPEDYLLLTECCRGRNDYRPGAPYRAGI